MPSAERFGDMLARLLDEAGLSQRDFAKKCGISGGYPAHFISNIRPPTLQKVDEMADALGLEGDRRAEFLEAAYLAHAPEEIRRLLEKVQSQASEYRHELDDLRAQFSTLAALARKHGIKVPKRFGDA